LYLQGFFVIIRLEIKISILLVIFEFWYLFKIIKSFSENENMEAKSITFFHLNQYFNSKNAIKKCVDLDLF